MNPRIQWLVVPLLVACAAAPAHAQVAEDLAQQYLLPFPPVVEIAARGPWVAPAISLGVPAAFGASAGQAFVAAGFQARTRRQDDPDGAVAAGFGIGDPRRAVGVELAATSFGTVNTCCRGGISVKVHRRLGAGTALAVGVENLGRWRIRAPSGEATTDAGTSVYGVVSTVLRLRPATAALSAVTLSAGVGNGRFRSQDDILDDNETVMPFGSVSVRLLPPVSVIADWTGQDLLLGGSVVPFPTFPLFIAPGVADVTTRARFILGVGIGFDYSDIF